MAEDLDLLLRSFERSLRQRNRSDRTIRSYADTARLLAGHVDRPLDEVTRQDLEGFFVAMLETRSPASVALYFRSLRAMFNWMVREEIVASSPMAGMEGPTVPEKPVPVVVDDDLTRLLKACEGKDFDARRDTAIVRLLLDTGIRVGELVGLAVDDVDFRNDVVSVDGKTGARIVPFSNRTGEALDRYGRERRRHPMAKLDGWWIGARGVMTVSGVQQMLRRRGAQAGVDDLRPHRFRHTAAHQWKAAGGSDEAAMQLFGWRSPEMLQRYGSSLAAQRARDEHRRLAPGDRL